MEPTPLILGIETATLGGSVCLAKGDRVLSSRLGDAAISHSNSLLGDINELLDETNTSLKDVALFAVAVGPGSFTGLRIGLATVKALAATLGRPSVGVPTLAAIARAASEDRIEQTIVSLLPAGRGELFAQCFSVSPERRVSERDNPVHVSPGKVFERYDTQDRIVWAGEGAHVYRQMIEDEARKLGIKFGESVNSPWVLAPLDRNLAKHVVALGFQGYLDGQSTSPELLQAIYVRPSDAELKTNVVSN